jgi:hypothetical protein
MEVAESDSRIEETNVQMLSNPSSNFKQLQGTVTLDAQSVNTIKLEFNKLTPKKHTKVDVEETLGLLTALY